MALSRESILTQIQLMPGLPLTQFPPPPRPVITHALHLSPRLVDLAGIFFHDVTQFST